MIVVDSRCCCYLLLPDLGDRAKVSQHFGRRYPGRMVTRKKSARSTEMSSRTIGKSNASNHDRSVA